MFEDNQDISEGVIQLHHQKPAGRYACGTVVDKNKLYIFGGYNDALGVLRDFWEYDFITRCWSELRVASFIVSMRNTILISYNQSIFLLGGKVWMDTDYEELTTVFEYNTSTKIWTNVDIQEGKSPRICAESCSAVLYRGLILLLSKASPHFFSLDLSSKKWSIVRTMGPTPELISSPWEFPISVCLHENVLFVMQMNALYQLDLKCEGSSTPRYTWSSTWSSAPCEMKQVVLWKNYIFGWGRMDGLFYCYNLQSRKWQKLTNSSIDTKSESGTLVVYDSSLFIFGGGWGDVLHHDLSEIPITERLPIEEKSVSKNKLKCEPKPRIVENNGFLINNNNWSDVHFLIDGKIIYAHRNILASGCPHFRALFSFGKHMQALESKSTKGELDTEISTVEAINQLDLTESQLQATKGSFSADCSPSDSPLLSPSPPSPPSPTSPLVIPISNTSYTTFLYLIRWIYTGSVSVRPHHAFSVLQAADYYNLEDLVQEMAELLSKSLSYKNVASTLILADRFSNELLKTSCLEYIITHSQTLLQSDCLQPLTKQKHCHLMMTLVRMLAGVSSPDASTFSETFSSSVSTSSTEETNSDSPGTSVGFSPTEHDSLEDFKEIEEEIEGGSDQSFSLPSLQYRLTSPKVGPLGKRKNDELSFSSNKRRE